MAVYGYARFPTLDQDASLQEETLRQKLAAKLFAPRR